LSIAAVSKPVNGIVKVGGPDKLSFADMAALVIAARGDGVTAVVDPATTYFDASVQNSSLVTPDRAHTGAAHGSSAGS
jgi:uncharacterized protein YbjT (DUF2867 family)